LMIDSAGLVASTSCNKAMLRLQFGCKKPDQRWQLCAGRLWRTGADHHCGHLRQLKLGVCQRDGTGHYPNQQLCDSSELSVVWMKIL
jgi:hypothetical protein